MKQSKEQMREIARRMKSRRLALGLTYADMGEADRHLRIINTKV